MSSGVEADIAIDAAVVLTLGLNRVLGRAAGLGAAGADAFAGFAAARAAAKRGAIDELERYDRAIRDVLDRNARIAALAEARREAERRFGVSAVALPAPLTIAEQSSDELAAWVARADAEIAEAERDLSQRVADAVAGRLFEAPAAGLTSDVASREAPRQPRQPRQETAETLRRVLSRLPPDTADADYQHVAEAAERVARAATPSAAEGLLTEVRLRVQRAAENARLRRAELARLAAEREAREQEEAEQRYVLDAITAAFTDMGYEVDAGFETLTAHDGEVLLTRDEWPQHAVKMRLDDASQIRAALLRTEAPAGDDERRLDVEREEQWCAAFEEARSRLAAAGVRSDVQWRIEPGLRQLPVDEARRLGLRDADRGARRGTAAKTQAKEKAKERPRERG
ncbi:MAG TPA: response regulator receiver protein [Streptosporangiaceae bacterium]|nr:response regulator receiver protein [Streptosporangiaceae bacterium]